MPTSSPACTSGKSAWPTAGAVAESTLLTAAEAPGAAPGEVTMREEKSPKALSEVFCTRMTYWPGLSAVPHRGPCTVAWMTVALCELIGRSHTPPAGKTICGLALSAKLEAEALMLKSAVPAVSMTAGEMEAMTGGWATTWKPSLPESEPNAPVASSTSMVYGPPSAMPLGQPFALVSVAGVACAPEQVGTTAMMVLAFT